MDSVAAHLLLCAVLLLSASTQALTGFGFGLVALAILGSWMDLRDAVVLTAPAGLVLNIALFLKLRRAFTFDDLVPLLMACLAGVPIGVWLVLNMGPRGLKLLMAFIMITTALHRMWVIQQKEPGKVWHPVKAGIPCGLLSGILGGAFGVGGPPVVSYLVNRSMDRFRYVATVQVVAGGTAIIRLVQFAQAGRYEEVPYWMFVTTFASVLIGVFIGMRLLRKISDQGSQKGILVFLILGGLYYLIQA